MAESATTANVPASGPDVEDEAALDQQWQTALLACVDSLVCVDVLIRAAEAHTSTRHSPACGTRNSPSPYNGWHEPVDRIGGSHRYQASPDNRTDVVGFRCPKDAPG